MAFLPALFENLHSFNHIKEEFATARYLYYVSQSQDKNIVEASSITQYIETFDYADFGLISGFLKTSLRLALDCLNKCAGFLNFYLELNHSGDSVILNNIWYVNLQHKKGFHSKISQLCLSNQYLAALYDLHRDLYRMNTQLKSLHEIIQEAIQILSKEMGIADTIRFLNQFS